MNSFDWINSQKSINVPIPTVPPNHFPLRLFWVVYLGVLGVWALYQAINFLTLSRFGWGVAWFGLTVVYGVLMVGWIELMLDYPVSWITFFKSAIDKI